MTTEPPVVNDAQPQEQAQEKKKTSSLLVLAFLIIALPVLLYSTYQMARLQSRAKVPATPPTPPETPTPTPTPVFQLMNGSFELDEDGDTVPDSWRKGASSDVSDARTSDEAHDGTYSFRFEGNGTRTETLSQTLRGTWAADTTLYIDGWLKTVGTGRKAYSVYLKVTYVDNSYTVYRLDFPAGQYDWTFRGGTFRLTNTAKQIAVFAAYPKQTGAAFYDHLRLSDAPLGEETDYTTLSPLKTEAVRDADLPL